MITMKTIVEEELIFHSVTKSNVSKNQILIKLCLCFSEKSFNQLEFLHTLHSLQLRSIL